MYFKSLEIYGFKSFAERTRLDFEPGITAIVGPNGCGKSNIADSIKWVLGEQSAKVLRGGKMEDVIFNGTDGKEPVNFAEVSLTLSNQDRILPIEYDEVTVTRRLYRSGESEYLLNGTAVRLKDINEIFMGTGIGTSAYSLIEQGRIDQVLSSRPEDRREIFEEASGITKFKSKKREALRRLEETEANTVRINDIVLEVKRQIGSIERQVRKAERYREKFENLKALELKLSRIEFESIKSSLNFSTGKVEESKVKEFAYSSELVKIKDELYELNKEKSLIEGKRVELKSSMMKTDFEITKARDKVSLDRERIEELGARCADLEIELKNISDNIVLQEKEVSSLRNQLDMLNNEDQNKGVNLEDKEKRLGEVLKEMKKNEVNIVTSKANIIDITTKQAKLRSQIAKLSTIILSHGSRIKRLESEKTAVAGEKDNLDAKANDARQETETIINQISALKAEKDCLNEDLSKIQGELKGFLSELGQIQKDLSSNKSRLEMLQEARLRYEGFSTGVRAILDKSNPARPQIEGIHDSLANLFNAEKGFETAIESALGEYLEAIVVSDISSVEKAMAYLKENAIGKAAFLYLGYFKPEDMDSISIQDARILGKAVKFINRDEAYNNLLSNILKNIFVVKDLQDARSLLAEKEELKIATLITLSGEVVSGGFISGGSSVKDGSTLVNRDIMIKELSELNNVYEQKFVKIKDESLLKESQKTEIEARIQTLSQSINEREVFFADANARKIALANNLKQVMDEISIVNMEIDEVNGEVEAIKKEEQSSIEALANIENEFKMNEERIKQSEQFISEFLKEKEALITEITQKKSELGALEHKKEGLSNTLNILENSFKDAKNNMENRKNEFEFSLKKIEELKQEMLALDQLSANLSEGAARCNRELEDVEVQYNDSIKRFQDKENIFSQLEKDLNVVKAEVHAFDLKKTEASYSVENLTQRIRDIYKLELDTYELAHDWQGVDTQQLKLEVQEAKSYVEGLGTVNLVAIEEHTELQERYKFLTSQVDDLVKAKESLKKAITEINKTTKELFVETFRSIQVEFRSFFKMLFNGGDGELLLLDEDNVLECGIEIVARPPGKRLQNVSLLSGGEKALTAVALLFAIFKVKPSPFCVLDEIDAPLDESNVDRFSRSLDLFTNTSQFIVITHNKKTIDKADLMYGITMQQSGVSRIVSVKFSDVKKEEEKNSVQAG